MTTTMASSTLLSSRDKRVFEYQSLMFSRAKSDYVLRLHRIVNDQQVSASAG